MGAGIALAVVAGPVISATSPAAAKAAASNSVLAQATKLLGTISGTPPVA